MKILGALLVSAAVAAAGPAARMDRPAVKVPELVTIPAGAYTFRASGDWTEDGRHVAPPLLERRAGRALDVTKYQISQAEYRLCVVAGACVSAGEGADTLPQTGVSWHDAAAYARWLSAATGQAWRLPTDEEWQRLAAERFVDDAVAEGDPGQRLLAGYARNVAGREDREAEVRPRGAGGENSMGVSDLAINVWEWTDTCVVNGVVDEAGIAHPIDTYCGARVVAGQHRAVVIDFVRDARGGGCGAGVPPDFLGFRLVRERP